MFLEILAEKHVQVSENLTWGRGGGGVLYKSGTEMRGNRARLARNTFELNLFVLRTNFLRP